MKPRTKSDRRLLLERVFGPTAPSKHPFFRRLYWAFRRWQYWLCFYDDEVEVDVEDLLSNPFNTAPPSLDQLSKVTGFDRKWITFLYRNFKQRCSSGRMGESQWRSVCKSLFPNAIDYSFADRLYTTIARRSGAHTMLTFEDLVLFLYDLSTSSEHSATVSTAMSPASFAFNLCRPDQRGRVSLPAFTEYVRSVYGLLPLRTASCENAALLGLPTGSIHRNKTDLEIPPTTLPPGLQVYARERFKELDLDQDGYITIEDVERVMSRLGTKILFTMADLAKHAESASPSQRECLPSSRCKRKTLASETNRL